MSRVARPNAGIALITYGVLHLEGPIDSIVQCFCYETIGPYWPPERRRVEEGYRDLPFPFKERQVLQLSVEVSWTPEDLVGYVNTSCTVKAAEKALGFNPLMPFEEGLSSQWRDWNGRRLVNWPLSTRVGNVPPAQ